MKKGRSGPRQADRISRFSAISLLMANIFLIVVLNAVPFSFSEALPLSRFTERVTATGETQRGIDDNQPEDITINRPGFFGKAQTSGTGAALPGASGPYAESLLDMNSGEGGLSSATISYYFGVVVADQPPPPGVTVVPLIIDAVLSTEITVRGQGNISDNLAEISVFNGETTERDSINIIDLADRNVRREARFRIPMALGPEGNIFLRTIITAGGALRIRTVADPYIYIDPAFPEKGYFKIVVGSGVENLPPEPSVLQPAIYLPLVLKGP